MSNILECNRGNDSLIEIEELKINGKSLFSEGLKQRERHERAVIRARLERVKRGNLGHHRNLRYGVLELKFDNGFRIYGGWQGHKLLLLILCGSKKQQSEDIEVAQRIWVTYTKGITP